MRGQSGLLLRCLSLIWRKPKEDGGKWPGKKSRQFATDVTTVYDILRQLATFYDNFRLFVQNVLNVINRHTSSSNVINIFVTIYDRFVAVPFWILPINQDREKGVFWKRGLLAKGSFKGSISLRELVPRVSSR